MKDEIGTRMKEFYENRTRISLPRRAYTIIRLDGKAFHTYTRGLKKPFDENLMVDMNQTAIYLCKNIMGAKFAFVQSDEISILLADFEELGTQSWFDSNIQKMVSVSASMATHAFNKARLGRIPANIVKSQVGDVLKEIDAMKWAEFDSRVFQIPMQIEVENYFIWRQQDATRNSISSVAQNLYSHKELNGKTTDMMQDMIFDKGINWNDFPAGCKRGRLIIKETYEKMPGVTRSQWITVEPPIFSQDRDCLRNMIPNNF